MPRKDGTPTTTELRKWARQVDRGERSRAEIERTELGTSGRGKTFTRMLASRGLTLRTGSVG